MPPDSLTELASVSVQAYDFIIFFSLAKTVFYLFFYNFFFSV